MENYSRPASIEAGLFLPLPTGNRAIVGHIAKAHLRSIVAWVSRGRRFVVGQRVEGGWCAVLSRGRIVGVGGWRWQEPDSLLGGDATGGVSIGLAAGC